MRTFVPQRVADIYLEQEGSRALLILANCLAILVGINFYLPQLLANRNVVLWPVIADSPLSVAWVTFSLFALSGAGAIADYRNSWFHDLVDTLAFVSLFKYGMWTVFTLNYFFFSYYPDLWSYFGILFAHVVMVGEAFLLPYYANTSKPILAVALGWLLLGDVADYAFGLYPHLRVESLGVLPEVTVFLSFASVTLAWYCLDEA